MTEINCAEDQQQSKLAYKMSLLEVLDSINNEELLEDHFLSLNQNSYLEACKDLELPLLKVKVLLLSTSDFVRDEVEKISAYKISQNKDWIELLKPTYDEKPEVHNFKFDPSLDDNNVPIRIYDLNDFIDNIDNISFIEHWATIALQDEQGECLVFD